MCLNDALVVHRDRENRNTFGRGTLEIKEDAPVLRGGLCQSFACIGVQIVTQFEKGIPRDDFIRLQSQPFAAEANPLSGLCFALSVIIVV